MRCSISHLIRFKRPKNLTIDFIITLKDIDKLQYRMLDPEVLHKNYQNDGKHLSLFVTVKDLHKI